jgi:hypothetical protein
LERDEADDLDVWLAHTNGEFVWGDRVVVAHNAGPLLQGVKGSVAYVSETMVLVHLDTGIVRNFHRSWLRLTV